MGTTRPALEVADIFRRHGPAWRQTERLSLGQLKVMSAIEQCRSAALGGHALHCEGCGHAEIAYNSCRNRHCPKCQAKAAKRWLEARQADLLPVEYFPKHLGAQIGMTMVLHTWGSALTHHPHVHGIFLGGGLAPDGARWVACRHGFFLPVKVFFILVVAAAMGGLAYVLLPSAGDSTVGTTNHEQSGKAMPVTIAARNPLRVIDKPFADNGPNGVELGRAMRERFNTATNYRAFIFEALKRPREGGYMYAYGAIGACRVDSNAIKTSGTPSAPQREAADTLAKRCDMTEAERSAAFVQIAHDRQAGNLDADPLMKLTFDVLNAKSVEQKRDVIASILNSQDPSLLSSLVTAAAVDFKEGANTNVRLHFGGRYYDVDDDADVLFYAMQLAQCSLGEDCGATSIKTLKLCINYGWCGASYAEALRAGLGADRAEFFAQIKALAEQLIIEIRRKNIGAFMH